MKHIYLLISLIFCFSCHSDKQKETKETPLNTSYSPTLLWESTEGFVHPESVILSLDKDYYFVSNIGSDENEGTANGFISKVNLNGSIIALKFTDNIRSPKGLCIANNKLYVSALSELLEIDLQSGEVLNSYMNPDIVFLNDVTADEQGNVYVSGMRESKIYKLTDSGELTTWYSNSELEHPNGLLCLSDKILVGGWGSMDDEDLVTDSISYLFELDYATKTLSKVTENRIGKVDGIQKADQDIIISSWKAGEVSRINKDTNKAQLLLKTETSVGDIMFDESNGIIILPMNFQHKLVAYK